MTCPNQLELGEGKTDGTATEGPHSVGVWTLKRVYLRNINLVSFRAAVKAKKASLYNPQKVAEISSITVCRLRY